MALDHGRGNGGLRVASWGAAANEPHPAPHGGNHAAVRVFRADLAARPACDSQRLFLEFVVFFLLGCGSSAQRRLLANADVPAPPVLHSRP